MKLFSSSKYFIVLALSPLLLALPAHAESDNDGFINLNVEDTINEAKVNHLAFQAYDQAQQKIIANPQAMLEAIVELINNPKFFFGANELMYKVQTQYRSDLPAGTIVDTVLTTNSHGENIMTLVMHDSVRTNPYSLLEAMIALEKAVKASDIAAVKMTLKPGANVHHHAENAYHSQKFKLSNLIHAPGMMDVISQPGILSLIIHPIIEQEMKNNARAGSTLAQRKLAESASYAGQLFKVGMTKFLPITKLDDASKKKYFADYAKMKGFPVSSSENLQEATASFFNQSDLHYKRNLDQLNASAKKAYKARRDEYKKGAAEREQLVQTKSLSEMVKANDREGVAKAMEVMIPWPLLEPTEKVFWKDYIEAVRHPNYTNAPILFRGLDKSEKLQSITDAKGNVIGGGMFSKRLTAGSGSHLYKLKGLPETFETLGTGKALEYFPKDSIPLNFPHTLTGMMINHARNPQGSPFISLTYELTVAWGFAAGEVSAAKVSATEKQLKEFLNSNASGGVATVRIDKRRLLTNSFSAYPGELEVLSSMLIFPDEVLYLEKGLVYEVDDGVHVPKKVERVSIEDYYARARSAVYQKTGINLPKDFDANAEANYGIYKNGVSELTAIFSRANPEAPLSCARIFQ